MKFKVGDNILVTKDLISVFCPEYPIAGTIVAVFDWNDGIAYHVTLELHNRKYLVYGYQLELVKEEPAPKFKIGDRIKIVKTTHCFSERLHQIGVVVEIEGRAGMSYLIKLENAQLWLCEEDIEKLEDTPEPKIDAVVKCIDACNGLTLGKYYSVKHLHKNCCTIEGIEGIFNINIFNVFKVGDRFKGQILFTIHDVKIIGLHKGNDTIYVEYQFNDNSTSCDSIAGFDRRFEKIEDEPVKQEPKPKFQLGQRVKLSGCFDHLKEGYVIYVNYNETRSEFTYSVEDAIGDYKRGVGNISEKDLKLVEPELKVGDYVEVISESNVLYTERWVPFSNVCAAAFGKISKITRIIDGKYYLDELPSICKEIYDKHNLRKVDKPKPEWQPKFKVGDWVIGNGYIVRIRGIESIKNKSYQVFNSNGSRSTLFHFEHSLELWQPMQELKANNERLQTLIHAKNEMLDKERSANKELKDRIEKQNEAVNSMTKIMEKWANY